MLYAPTFQAQPIALAQVGLERQTEAVNAALVALSRSAAPNCLIAGDLTTLAAFCDSWDPENFDLLVDNYRRQIRGLLDGGADLLVAETLMYPQEAEAILTAAELEQAGAVMYSFVMQADGSLFSGIDAGPVLRSLEESGAAAVGFNCVAADRMTPYLVSKLRRYVRGPLLCKPNAGNPVIDAQGQAQYSMSPAEFAEVMHLCQENGATLLGGCCGTDPEFIRQLVEF
jgi:5-methyltetrahydrofolate--homocysteine methyltransferase